MLDWGHEGNEERIGMRLHLHLHPHTYNTCKCENTVPYTHTVHTYNTRAQQLTTRDSLAFTNTAAIAYGPKIGQSLRILVVCNNSRAYKLQRASSTVSCSKFLLLLHFPGPIWIENGGRNWPSAERSHD